MTITFYKLILLSILIGLHASAKGIIPLRFKCILFTNPPLTIVRNVPLKGEYIPGSEKLQSNSLLKNKVKGVVKNLPELVLMKLVFVKTGNGERSFYTGIPRSPVRHI